MADGLKKSLMEAVEMQAQEEIFNKAWEKHHGQAIKEGYHFQNCKAVCKIANVVRLLSVTRGELSHLLVQKNESLLVIN